jgi:hypothetical protein
MKHNADQFELFPPSIPKHGELVRVLEWNGRKHVPGRFKWKVISWPLYYLLSGDDPEGWETNDGHRNTPEPGSVPLIATHPLGNKWSIHANTDFLPWCVVRSIAPAQIARGY